MDRSTIDGVLTNHAVTQSSTVECPFQTPAAGVVLAQSPEFGQPRVVWPATPEVRMEVAEG